MSLSELTDRAEAAWLRTAICPQTGSVFAERTGNGVFSSEGQFTSSEGDVDRIFFVWETGLFNTIEHLLAGARQRGVALGARDFFDFTTDPLLETIARAAGGPRIQGGMKRSAELASNPGVAGQPKGGGFYVAEQLSALCRRHPGKIELHAIGHSAGAVFHSHFLPAALAMPEVLNVKTLSLLARQ